MESVNYLMVGKSVITNSGYCFEEVGLDRVRATLEEVVTLIPDTKVIPFSHEE